jgi:hypothetical protein
VSSNPYSGVLRRSLAAGDVLSILNLKTDLRSTVDFPVQEDVTWEIRDVDECEAVFTGFLC